MDYASVVRRRRMVRNYDPTRPVPPDVLSRLLDYAIRAPSAGFSQGWGFLVLVEPADRSVFWSATSPPVVTSWLDGMRNAPVIVIPHSNRDVYLSRYAEADKGFTDRDESGWPVPYWHIDAGFASLLMLLGAVDAGLGACFFGIPAKRMDAYRSAFDVPAEFTPIGAITIGYPAPDRRSPSVARGRRPVSEVAHVGRWHRPYPASAADTKQVLERPGP